MTSACSRSPPSLLFAACPVAHRDEPDRVADGFGDGVADRELQVLLGECGDQGVGVARAVRADQDLLAAPPVWDLAQRPVQHGEVVGGGVAAGVARAQQHCEGLAGVVQPGPEGVMAEAALEVPASIFLVRVGRDSSGV